MVKRHTGICYKLLHFQSKSISYRSIRTFPFQWKPHKKYTHINNIDKDPVINHGFIQRMCKESERRGTPKFGGILLMVKAYKWQGLWIMGFVGGGLWDTLFSQWWETIRSATTVMQFIFLSTFICMDWAAINKSLCKYISCCTSAIAENVVWLQSKLCCIMNFSHVIKK